MTTLLEQALARVRLWPKKRQDEAAALLLDMAEEGSLYPLSDFERAAIGQARDGVHDDRMAFDREDQGELKTSSGVGF